MGKYTKISADAFQNMQLDAGVILNTFNPSSPAEPSSENIVCATTGGIKVDCVPTYSDLGEDVDNVPNNMKEFKHLDSWEAKIGFTARSASPLWTSQRMYWHCLSGRQQRPPPTTRSHRTET